MQNLAKFATAAGLIAILGLCGGSGAATAATEEAAIAQAPVPPAAFAPCTACHSVVHGRHIFGPSLAGVAGRKAGSVPGFPYSTALKNSGLTWNATTLTRWLTSPQRTVPGTRMPFTGIPDPVKRKAVVDYLLTLK